MISTTERSSYAIETPALTDILYLEYQGLSLKQSILWTSANQSAAVAGVKTKA